MDKVHELSTMTKIIYWRKQEVTQKLKLTFLIVRLELPLEILFTERSKISFQEKRML